MKYADDIGNITSNHSSMENFQHNTSEILKPIDLNVNHDKKRTIHYNSLGTSMVRMDHVNGNRDFHLTEHPICVKLYVKVNKGLFFRF